MNKNNTFKKQTIKETHWKRAAPVSSLGIHNMNQTNTNERNKFEERKPRYNTSNNQETNFKKVAPVNSSGIHNTNQTNTNERNIWEERKQKYNTINNQETSWRKVVPQQKNLIEPLKTNKYEHVENKTKNASSSTLDKPCQRLIKEEPTSENRIIQNPPSNVNIIPTEKIQKVYERSEIISLMKYNDMPDSLKLNDTFATNFVEENLVDLYFLIEKENNDNNQPDQVLSGWKFRSISTKLVHHGDGYLAPQLRKIVGQDDSKSFEKQVKVILNRLTPENFNCCVKEIRSLKITNEQDLKCLAEQIFYKAIQEESYCTIYSKLSSIIKDLSIGSVTYKILLLAKCKTMFDKDIKTVIEEVKKTWSDKIEQQTTEWMKSFYESEIEEQVLKAKDKYFGNIKFISELYLQNVISSRIILYCIKTLLTNDINENSMEAVCKMLQIVGKSIESVYPKYIGNIIAQLTCFSSSKHLDTRTKFRLKDIIDMKKRKWELREIQKVQNIIPKTFKELEKEQQSSSNSSVKTFVRDPAFRQTKNIEKSNDSKIGKSHTTLQKNMNNPITVGRKVPDSSLKTIVVEIEEEPKENSCLMNNLKNDDDVVSDLLKEIMENTATIDCWKKVKNPNNVLGIWLDQMLEKKSDFRSKLADYIHQLIQTRVLEKDVFIKEFNSIMEYADDLVTDIPKLWEFLAEFLERFVIDEKSHIQFFNVLFKPIKSNPQVKTCLMMIKQKASERLGMGNIEV